MNDGTLQVVCGDVVDVGVFDGHSPTTYARVVVLGMVRVGDDESLILKALTPEQAEALADDLRFAAIATRERDVGGLAGQ